MKAVVVILSMFAVALCAPTGEKADVLDVDEVDSDDMRVKRAKEIMMFGNQQNDKQNDKAKRADPPESDDKNGYIVAHEPVDLETEETEETEEPFSDAVVEQSADVNTDGNEADDSIPEYNDADTKSEEDVESTETEESEEATAVEPVEKADDQMSLEDYLKELENLQADADNISPYFNNILRDRDPWEQYRYYNPYSNYQRYRRSQARALRNYQFPRARVLKRAHRTKRQAYYVPDVQGYLPYDDDILNTPYNNYPVTEDDLADLLDVLDDAKIYDDGGIYVNPYEEYQPYEQLEDLEFESPIYVPKRQAGLTFVPGIKRNRDFYPSFSEPGAHFAAFVPDKRSMRDYADAYERVMELAAALRQQNYYPEEFLEGYRRKK